MKDAILRALNEKQLYGAPIVALPKPVSHLIYDEMVMREFQPKQRKKYQWTSEEVTILLETIKNISNGNLVPMVIKMYKYIYV